MFNDCVSKLLEERTNFSVVEVLRLQSSLLNYALKSYPGKLEYVSHCISNCAQILAAKGGEVSATFPAGSLLRWARGSLSCVSLSIRWMRTGWRWWSAS